MIPCLADNLTQIGDRFGFLLAEIINIGNCRTTRRAILTSDRPGEWSVSYWIFKSEPDEYGIDHLAAEKTRTARWDGIRNYQARNNLRDKVGKGDLVLFYHSSCKQIGVAGTMEVVRAAYPDPAQFDPDSAYYDAKSDPEDPRWYCVDVRLVEKFPELVPTRVLKAHAGTAGLSIFQQGRLSIAPVTAAQWRAVHRLAGRAGS
jgi:predicted RNA-binding protein with PUA-like domain